MLRENWRFISRIERLGDLLIVIASFLLAYYGRGALIGINQAYDLGLRFEGAQLAPVKDYFIVLAVGLMATLSALHLLGAYGSMRLADSWRLVRTALIAGGATFVAESVIVFTLKLDLSRSFVGTYCVLLSLLIFCERLLVLRLLRYWRRKGRNFRNVLVCGVGEQAERIVQQIQARAELGIRVRGVGVLVAEEFAGRHSLRAEELFRDFKRRLRAKGVGLDCGCLVGATALERSLKELAIDEVIFTDIVEVMPQVEEMIVICSEEGIRTTLAADLFSLGMAKSAMSNFAGMPMIHFQTPPGDHWELSLKRGVDIVVSLSLLLLFSPVFLLSFVGVKATSQGPALFKQKRMGLNGRVFSLYKFRSMYEGAEGQLEELRELNEMEGPVFKLRNDPRVTPFGRFMRRFSLDELPQLWNVLRGDMSLVGPRPPIPGEVRLYERRDRRRLSMRPGLTCTWQVSGRNEISDFEAWVKLDLDYIDNWSLGRDFVLIFRTIPAVLFGHGAR